jgi:hypothetical protein
MTDDRSSPDIVKYINDVEMRELLSATDVGKGRSILRRILAMRSPDEAAKAPNPRVIDTDDGEIAVTLDGRELRGWSYSSDTQRQIKMLCAREYVEGWCDGRSS